MRTLLVLLVSVALFGCTEPENPGLPSPATGTTGTEPDIVQTGDSLTFVAYNIESGDSSLDTVANNVSDLAGPSLWGFVELPSRTWLDRLAEEADDGSQDMQTVLGTTGNTDRMAVVWDANVLQYIDHRELFDINIGGSVRAPLVVEFEVVASGARFTYVLNHLWRTNDSSRHQQASMLRDWAQTQSGGLIAGGDYNFDWAVEDGESDHDEGYDRMTSNGVWEWVRPDELIPTQCSNLFRSVLDFAFVAGDARDWEAESEILLPGNAYCQDDAEKPDHRPVEVTLFVPDP